MRLLLGGMALLLLGCATPAGRFTESDFVSREVTFSGPVAEALGNFYQGMRYCGPDSGGLITSRLHGIAECAPVPINGVRSCDIYLVGMFGEKDSRVMGRVDFFERDGRTLAVLKARTWIGYKEEKFADWAQFIHGNARQVCPAK